MEWALVAVVIVLLGGMFFRQVRAVQGQGELAAIKSTLGALRTALVIDHLKRTIDAGKAAAAAPQANPFELLQRRPANYLGEMNGAQALTEPGGNWVFDPACPCVGYLPLSGQWLESRSGDSMLWFELIGAPGPVQLTAREPYLWQGNAVD